MNHYANRTLIVSCTKDCTQILGRRFVRSVGCPYAPGSLLATDRSKAVVLV